MKINTFLVSIFIFSILILISCGSDSKKKKAQDVVFQGQVIANWDVIPYQVFNSTFKVGVVAFDEDGVDVVFSVLQNGTQVGSSITKSAPTLNDRTGVYEYWIDLNAADYSDGEITVRFTASSLGGANEERSMDLILYANSGGALAGYNNSSEKYVDCTSGSDSNSGNAPADAYATLEKGYNAVGAGGTVYLVTGTCYQITDTLPEKKHKYWTTITSISGTNTDVEIKGGTGAAFDESMVKWGAVTLYMNEDASLVNYLTLLTFRAGDYIWFDGTLLIDKHPNGYTNGGELFNNQNAKFYMTNSEISDITVADGYFQRDCSIHGIGGDVWRAKENMLLVNINVDNMDPIPEAHPDLIQWLATAENPIGNIILYNVKVTNMNSQGIFGSNAVNVAFVNLLMEKSVDSYFGTQVTDFKHILIWHCTVHNLSFTIHEIENMRNWNVRNNIFYNFSPSGYTVENPAPLEMSDSIISYNHYTNINWNQTDGPMGTNYTSGDPLFVSPTAYGAGYHTPGTEDYHLQGGSPAYRSGTQMDGVPADIEGSLYNVSSPSRGAFAN